MRKLILPVVVNLVLGVPAIVPFFLLWYGWASWSPTEFRQGLMEPSVNEEPLGWAMIAGPFVFGFGGIWLFVNWLVRGRRTMVPRLRYWSVCVAATLVPYLSLGLWDALH